MSGRKLIAASAALLLCSSVGAFAAENGTTLAGPAQGSKANGSSSMTPSGDAGGRPMSSGSMERSSGGAAATGTMSGGSTATGGNAGGPAGRN